MRKCYLILFLLTVQTGFSQTQEKRITISFENSPLPSVFELLEQQTDYTFYYIDDWVANTNVSGNYQIETVATIIEDILEDTVLNFYTTEDNRIILLQNTIVYEELPRNFFGKKETETTTTPDTPETSINAPVFYNEAKTATPTTIETVRIGKVNTTTTQQKYILRGQIRNSENGSPLENVAVTIDNSNLGTVTDAQGNYSLELSAGVRIISVNLLGFAGTKKRVVLYNNGTLDFGIIESLEGLDEVVLIGNVNKNIEDTNVGTTQVDVENIKNIPLVLGERDVFKAAATLPGIASAGEGASGYNVRGGKEDQNLILLDDGVLYNPVHFFGIFSAINPFTSNEVTVYKGHIPAKYGGRLASVFDIKTKDANVEKFSGEASIGPVTSNLVLETPIVKDKAAILVGGRTTFTDIILRNLDEEELRNSEASFYDVVVKYNHELNEKNKISATGYYSRDAFSITSDSLFKYKNRMVSLQWEHKFEDAHKAKFTFSNTGYDFDLNFEGQANNNFDLQYRLNETNIQAGFVNKISEKHTLGYGLSTKLYANDPGDRSPNGNNSIITATRIPRERALEAALHISDIFDVTDRLTAEAGLRFSFFAALGESVQNIYVEGVPRSNGTLIEQREFGSNEIVETYTTPEYRLALRYLIMPDLALKGSLNRQAQYIHKLTTNTTASPVDTYKLSNINIAPQRGLQYSLGVFKNFKEGMYEASVEGYYKTATDILDYKVGAEVLLNETLEQDVLQGEGRSYGVEFLLKKNKGSLNGWVGYTYSRSMLKLDSEFSEERVNNGEFFPSNYDKPHDFSLVANYKITRRFSFSGNFVYQTGRPVTVPIGNVVVNNAELVVFSDRNEFRIPDYYRLDLSFNVEGNHKRNKLAHSFWNISVYNVLGRNNPYSVFFVAEDGNVKAFQTSIFSVPIPTVSYNLKF